MSSQLVTCRPSGPTQENFCSKVTTSGTGQTTTIMRTCSVAGVNNCMERNGVNECTTACASDGCNIAYITRPALLATLIWICLTYLLTNLLVLTNWSDCLIDKLRGWIFWLKYGREIEKWLTIPSMQMLLNCHVPYKKIIQESRTDSWRARSYLRKFFLHNLMQLFGPAFATLGGSVQVFNVTAVSRQLYGYRHI